MANPHKVFVIIAQARTFEKAGDLVAAGFHLRDVRIQPNYAKNCIS
jgi:hypothetical protein